MLPAGAVLEAPPRSLSMAVAYLHTTDQRLQFPHHRESNRTSLTQPPSSPCW
jgi:hypothetical protein